MGQRNEVESIERSRRSDEALAAERIKTQLLELSRPSSFAAELATTPLEPYQELLAREFGVTVQLGDFTPPIFVSHADIAQVEVLTGLSLEDLQAAHLTEFNLMVLTETGNQIVDSHNYWHEQVHGLGKNMLVRLGDDETFNRVGYQVSRTFTSSDENGQVVDFREIHLQGEFLEEAVVDWVAARLNVFFWQQRGVALRELDSVAMAGEEKYIYIRKALRHLFIEGGPEVERLLLQARFDIRLLHKLCASLNTRFGPGSANVIFSLPFNIAMIGDAISSLT